MSRRITARLRLLAGRSVENQLNSPCFICSIGDLGNMDEASSLSGFLL